MKPRIYIDTSIVGGYFDDEFADATRALFERLENREVIFVLSSVLEQELKKHRSTSGNYWANSITTALNASS